MSETPEAVVARHMQAELDGQLERIAALRGTQWLALLIWVWPSVPADVRAFTLAEVSR